MDEFIKKLIERLEERQNDIAGNLSLDVYYSDGYDKGIEYAIAIVNQLEEEYNNDFCEWNYDGAMYERCPHTETLFARIHNCDEKIFKFCPYCGKRIKVVE